MENDRVAKMVYVGGVSRPRNRWIDKVKDFFFLIKRIHVNQTRMAYDRSEWWRFLRGIAWGVARGIIPNFDEMPQLLVATFI